jgi:GrpB-like predicted nucleotidyltransferase (UPF0157 family)
MPAERRRHPLLDAPADPGPGLSADGTAAPSRSAAVPPPAASPPDGELLGLADFELVHFGSTATGLAAKPIIDIMLISGDQPAWPALIEPIKALGYVFWADNPRRDRLFFVKGMPPFGPRRTHHVHVRTPEDARTALLFCEHLRRHPDEAARYAALKRELSARYPTERDAYTEGRARYVDDIVRQAATP